MKKCLIAFSFLAMAFSCAKAPVVEVTAAFSTDKDVYQVDEAVVITNESTVKGDILAFCKWEYGYADNISYAYKIDIDDLKFSTPGTYTITLTAYAEQGAGQDSCTKTIKVIEENDIPWADFTCPATAKVGEEVLFEDKSIDNVGGIENWIWTIGAEESRYQSPLIVFDKPALGVEVILTVIDKYGARDSVTKLIDVIE